MGGLPPRVAARQVRRLRDVPLFDQFIGNIVFKSYIPGFATGTVRVEDPAHPVVKGLLRHSRSERRVVHLRPIAWSDVHVLATVDENSYEPARSVKMGDYPVI